MLNQISLANTFQHLVTLSAGLTSLMNQLTDGPVFIANTQIQVTGAGTSLIVNNSILVGNTIHVNGSLNLISNQIKTNGGAATISLPTVTDTLIGANNTVTLINKTLNAPNINSPVITTNGGAASILLPQSSDTLVGKATTDVLTNKTLTAPAIANGTLTGTSTVSALKLIGHTIVIDGGATTITLPPSVNADVILAGNLNQTMISKTLENCTLANSFNFSAPSSGFHIPNKQYIDDVVAAALTAQFTTGDVKLTLKTTADTGWVIMDDGSIGNASSAATTRANADTQSLFVLIYNNTIDGDCPVSGGRTGNATNDFNSNKRLTLPKALGRALAKYGTGSGLNAKRLGEILGQENTIVPLHSHGINDPGHFHTTACQPVAVAGGTTFQNGANQPPTGVNSDTKTTGITIQNAGESATGKNWAPTLFLNVMLKL